MTPSGLIPLPTCLRCQATPAVLPLSSEVVFTNHRTRLAQAQGTFPTDWARLEETGPIMVCKMFTGRKPRTDVLLTTFGRPAMTDHRTASEWIFSGQWLPQNFYHAHRVTETNGHQDTTDTRGGSA